ncbi:glycosyltransferase [Limosilactobacillus fermentum]|uniref:Glycosyltransferase n=1 Tax=Limosilactobacillus fermentum (strain NBRC 3956 / LMG 18251) TaxID=334390 RepID=A0ABF7R0H6_LIMF3|nr:glycosyltransferase [Limosilactobacillus fermentum]EQC58607.1 glycosyl transferase [Limosilactobacillus fermentum MTCC 8711]BAG26425.1 putative glycosyltransferase [Limosilactobacillus fermentum IFO 3956]GEA97037.1 glycosyl transferase [Limosilactobacillus fermentum]
MKNDEFPAFSVLMSVYKKEEPVFLEKALESIENQTVEPDQIVLVEDGPITTKLNTVIVNHEKMHPNLYDIVKLTRNQGLGEALRIGLEYCNYDWIARMDTDDISVNTRFERQLETIKNHPELSVLGGQIDEFSNSVSNIVGNRDVPLTQSEIEKFMKWRSPFNHPTVFIKKETLKKVGGYGNQGNLEDYYLWIKILNQGYKVMNIPDVLVHMRVDMGLYKRRGNLKNIKYFLKLRKYMRKLKLLSASEEFLGDVIVVLNVIIPGWFRKMIYQYVLHRQEKSNLR